MADYPPTPSFGLPWGHGGQSIPRYHPHGHDDGTPDVSLMTKYDGMDNSAAFRQNENILGLVSPNVAPGVPPMPVYSSYTQQPQHSIQIPAVKTVEEGELSEGEFEDNPPKQSSAYQGVARVVRSPAQALTDSYGRSLDLQRQRSESYSPPDYNDDYEPALEPGQSQHKFREQNHNAGWPTTNSPADTHSSKFTKSLLNARKEAQGAILNLLPLKIRFQNYVEEGIDPEVVRRQFEAIGLAPSSQSIDAPDLTTAHVSPRIMNSRPADSFIVPQQDGNAGPKSVHTTGEERKDRIARLLAEKTRKLSSLTSSADSVNKLSSAETTAANKAAAASQISAKADKERMLRLKMEALQKSREQRAQKAATKVSVPQPTSPINISTSSAATAHRQDSSAAPQPTRQSLTPSVSEPVPVQDHNSAKPIAPSIPGLFLSASRNTPSPLSASEITSAVSQVVNPRKRPVASDFDVPPSAVQAYKRPFGHNRNDQPLVIDVSDDESDDGEQDDVDVVYPHSNINAFLGAFHNGAGSQKMSAMRDLPPLSDFPTRKHFTTPASGVSTPPATQSQAKSFTGKPEDLLRKEMEIEEMKRKIAEAERRKKAKQANSGSQTPGREEIKSSPMKPAAATSLPSTVDTSIQIELLIDDATRQINNDQEKLIITHAVEQARVDDLKRAQLDQRRLRRAKIASDLPAVDAEVEKSRKRLADLRAEVAQLEAAVQQGLDQKKILAEEMERLGQEADEQLQAQKNKLDYLRREEESNSVHHDDAGMEEESDNYEAATHLRKSPTAPTNSSKVSDNEEEEENGSDRQTHLVADMVPDRALDETFQDSSVRSDATRDSDIEDFYAPDPHELPSISSDSPTSPKQSDDRLAATDTDKAADSAVGESDHYEPPEATPSPMDTSSSGSAASSPVPPDDVSSTDRTDLQAVDSSVLAFTDIVSANHTASNPELAPQKVEGTEVKPEHADPEKFFTPYESPLSHFRAYRFHPGFKDEVSGGFKSLTYSNHITADQELCRYELAGGVCNDSSCEYQHFRDMGLADDAILVELGNSAGYSEEEKPRFVAGLRTVLQDLRARKIKDFQTIAAEIAAYRARFLGDNSRVLLLDGTSL